MALNGDPLYSPKARANATVVKLRSPPAWESQMSYEHRNHLRSLQIHKSEMFLENPHVSDLGFQLAIRQNGAESSCAVMDADWAACLKAASSL